MTRHVSILGSTGSIGQNTLDVIRHAPDENFKIVALTAGQNAKLLAEQAIEFDAEFVAIADPNKVTELTERLDGHKVRIGAGPDGLIEAARLNADFIMAAIVGAAGLKPTLAAVEQGNIVGLANKECLVCAGELFMSEVRKHGTTLLPIDSEHNAIFQVLDVDQAETVSRLILTASGGPFRTWTQAKLARVSVNDALKHPVWAMGEKISIDSATLMNKGLELIEASYLFGYPSEQIDIIVHPQSIIHSLVEYVDGSVLAQMGSPDMRTPIAFALGWPERISTPVKRLDLAALGELTFFDPDGERFPALGLARQALICGGIAPNVLNASNEIAVSAFLSTEIGFLDIAKIVEKTLSKLTSMPNVSHKNQHLDDIMAIDSLARQTATDLIKDL